MRKKSCFVFLAIIAMLCTNVKALQKTRIRFINVFGHKYVYLSDVANYYGMRLSRNGKNSTIYSKYSKIEFINERRNGKINSIESHFAYAPFLKNGQVFISTNDFFGTIDPILRHRALIKHKMKVIVIDPGHGGINSAGILDLGGRGKRYDEKDIALKIAKYLKRILNYRGYPVVLTRNGTQKGLSLDKRVAIANYYKADLFLSVHCNIAGTALVDGIETYCLTQSKTPSTIDTNSSSKFYNGNKYDKNNFRLAYEVQKSLITQLKASDRGVRRARFRVLKGIKCPAILIEAGFLSNNKEELKLGTKNYQYKIATSIANGIIKYHQQMLRTD